MKCTLFLMLVGLAFMAVHANPDPQSLAFKLSKLFRIDLAKAEMCVNKTTVTVDDLRALGDVALSHKPPVDQNSIRRASCTVACCAQAQGTMTGNKINLEAIQMLFVKTTIPEEWKLTVNEILTSCNDEAKSMIDECDVSFTFLMCLAVHGDKYGV